MDYLSGGDLRFNICKYRKFNEEQSKFIISCLILSLEYLHYNGIIHRDIKPENMVFDSRGYVYLTDMGIAKIYNPDKELIDSSGTPGYMAPEVITNKDHSFCADYFAVGIILHELMMQKVYF
jgi:serine/threonine protein kinase